MPSTTLEELSLRTERLSDRLNTATERLSERLDSVGSNLSRVGALETTVGELHGYLRVAKGVAAIFGLGAAFGAVMLTGVKSDMDDLDKKLKGLQETVDKAEKRFTEIRDEQQRQFVAFATSRKQEFDDHAKQVTAAFQLSIQSAVVAFDATKCPDGWIEYTPAYGRFIRGIDQKGDVDPDKSRAPGNLQEDALQSHQHGYDDRAPWGADAHPQGEGVSGNNDGGDRKRTSEPPTSARVATETRPKNVALLFCKRAQL